VNSKGKYYGCDFIVNDDFILLLAILIIQNLFIIIIIVPLRLGCLLFSGGGRGIKRLFLFGRKNEKRTGREALLELYTREEEDGEEDNCF